MHRSPIGVVSATLIMAVVTFGCTGSEVDDAGAGASVQGLSGSLGVIRIERGVDALTPELISPGGEFSAAFAQYRGVEGNAVLELLGRSRAATDLDACVRLDNGSDAFSDPTAEVDLLDAGSLTVSLAEEKIQVTARTFPELGTLVAGMFYAEDTELPLSRADIDEYRIQASGGPELQPFDVVAVGPPGVTDLTIDGSGSEQEVLIDRGRDIALTWSSGDPRDRVELDFVSGASVVTCLMRDDGYFRLDADVTGMMESDREARLLVRRIRAQGFDAPGIDVAWVSLASTRTMEITVR